MSQEQQGTFGLTETKKTGPVECLGQTFESDEARREHYLALLAEKLKDPEFRRIPGFPKGTDEAILHLSDPPYYTACPNPFLGRLLAQNVTRDARTQIFARTIRFRCEYRKVWRCLHRALVSHESSPCRDHEVHFALH